LKQLEESIPDSTNERLRENMIETDKVLEELLLSIGPYNAFSSIDELWQANQH
jgi:hypothetical protein